MLESSSLHALCVSPLQVLMGAASPLAAVPCLLFSPPIFYFFLPDGGQLNTLPLHNAPERRSRLVSCPRFSPAGRNARIEQAHQLLVFKMFPIAMICLYTASFHRGFFHFISISLKELMFFQEWNIVGYVAGKLRHAEDTTGINLL